MDQSEIRAMLDVDEHHWWYRGRRAIIRTELDRLPLPVGAQILDAGCGSGRTLAELVDYGDARGVELNPELAAFADNRGHGEVRVGRLEDLPWPDETFDLITCLDVIEHTPEDRVTLRELRRVTKPGGLLLVTVPAYQRLWSTHDEVNHHYRRYARYTLGAAAIASGWQVQRMTSFNSLLLAPAAAVRISQRQLRRRRAPTEHTSDQLLGPSWLNGVLEWPLQAEAKWLARGRTLPAGLSLLAVLVNPRPSA